jgi:hypothetical protein
MCHLFLILLFSRSLALNLRGGVMACPNSPHGLQRKILAPAAETATSRGFPQKLQRPTFFDFVDPFTLSFTKYLSAEL